MTHVSHRVRVALCDLMEALTAANVELLWPMPDVEGISPDAERLTFQLRDKVNKLIEAVQINDQDIKTE